MPDSQALYSDHRQDENERQLLIVNKTSRNAHLKSFLNYHSNLVDFFSASLIICLCFTILLPRVHESFLPANEQAEDEKDKADLSANEPNGTYENSLVVTGINVELVEDSSQHELIHGHHGHHHTFPTGEVLICIGFFVFYCIGLNLKRPGDAEPNSHQSPRRRRSITATVCCPSTRCPSSTSRRDASKNTNPGAQSDQHQQEDQLSQQQQQVTSLGGSDERALERQQTNADCVLLLNRHHQHHTHSRHHEHHRPSAANGGNQSVGLASNGEAEADHRVGGDGGSKSDDASSGVVANKRSDYGTSSSGERTSASLDALRTRARTTKIVVDEIRITSLSATSSVKHQCWPNSLKMLLVSLFLTAIIVSLDFNALGLLKTLRVFRAALTGALLYIAFFIMLPRQSAGCNSCQEEEN